MWENANKKDKLQKYIRSNLKFIFLKTKCTNEKIPYIVKKRK